MSLSVFRGNMYKAKTVFTSLIPLAPRMCGAERFASWLTRSNQPILRNSPVLAAATTRYYNKAATEPFLNGSTSSYVEEMYNAWLQDPHSVHVVSIYNNISENELLKTT